MSNSSECLVNAGTFRCVLCGQWQHRDERIRVFGKSVCLRCYERMPKTGGF